MKHIDLLLTRKPSSAVCTLGTMKLNGVFECYTLEDPTRSIKVWGATAIPAGVYTVIITMSNRFKRLLPLVMNVPGFEGIRIHPGNTAADTDGCILVGNATRGDSVINSRVAFEALFAKLQEADSITLTVE